MSPEPSVFICVHSDSRKLAGEGGLRFSAHLWPPPAQTGCFPDDLHQTAHPVRRRAGHFPAKAPPSLWLEHLTIETPHNPPRPPAFAKLRRGRSATPPMEGNQKNISSQSPPLEGCRNGGVGLSTYRGTTSQSSNALTRLMTATDMSRYYSSCTSIR